jgi:hypothetical protein
MITQDQLPLVARPKCNTSPKEKWKEP